MGNTLADLFAEIASRASAFDEPVLAHLCRTAAIEAGKTVIPWRDESRPTRVGLFDWDVANDINRVDSVGAEFFDVDPERAARGLPNANYLHAIHPDDMTAVNGFLRRCMQGGVSEVEYRVIGNHQPRWLFAKGLCTLDKSNRPERFAGMVVQTGNKLS